MKPSDEHFHLNALVKDALHGQSRAPLLSQLEDTLSHAVAQAPHPDTAHRYVAECLLEVLTSEASALSRRNAAWLLRRFGSRADTEYLAFVLTNDPDAKVRQFAAVALGRIGDASGVEGLAAAVDDADVGVRLNVVRALGLIGEPTVVGLLIRKLKNNKEDDEVQAMAARALGQLQAREALNTLFNSLNRKSLSISTESAMALARLGAPAMPRLLEALTNDKKHYQRRRRASAHALGWMVGHGFLGNNPDAITAAMESLIAESGSIEPGVREEVAQALGTTNDIRALEPLTIGLLYDVTSVRSSSAKALKELAAAGRVSMNAAVGPLVQATRDADLDVRNDAIDALGHTGHPDAIELLFALLDDAPDLATQYRALLALGHTGHEAVVKPVARYMRNRDAWMRRCAAVALGQLGFPRGRKALLIALNDPAAEVRQWSAIALGQLGDDSVLPTLAEHADDPDDRVRTAVQTVITALGGERN
jgi:HEAT repeat protein